MRDHLSRLAQIQEALGDGEYDKAADIAEKHLGMSSLQMHGAHEVSKYMPKGMQELGSSMHRSVGQSAIAEAYRIDSVPIVVIQGKYVTSPSIAKSKAKAIAVMDYLVNKVRKDKYKLAMDGWAVCQCL